MNNFIIDALKFWKKIKESMAHSEPCQISKMERLVKMVDGF